MDILPVNQLMQIVRASGHNDQQPQKRQHHRKKDTTGSRSVYTPDGRMSEKPAPKINIIA